jgi:SAM-dependent methyltransferase
MLDVGCGAGRNALPLSAQGWRVLGLDMSLRMLQAGAERFRQESSYPERAQRVEGPPAGRLQFALAPMDRLPVANRSCDFIVAHGIWNLAQSGEEFRRAVREAARAAMPGAMLFVFTFSRNTLAGSARPIDGESFVFTQFSGSPQCFLTEEELVGQLAAAGFVRDNAVPLHELNRRAPNSLPARGAPVIYEGTFRRSS